MYGVRLYHAGEIHEVALWARSLCVDCRFAELGQCSLVGLRTGLRPAICISAEGEAKARSKLEAGQ